jgi:hypothetical protein
MGRVHPHLDETRACNSKYCVRVRNFKRHPLPRGWEGRRGGARTRTRALATLQVGGGDLTPPPPPMPVTARLALPLRTVANRRMISVLRFF